ncbi:MAG TPA: hypothetical protein VJT09_06985 [Pyrinomonadaceae bacterium]|nr:hypothetical protein [Pyrinomonadaceae bacterium]
MKSTIIKNALVGIGLALLAAYLYPIFLFTLLEGPRGFLAIFSFFPFYLLLYSLWLGIPLGAALGMFIPQMAKGKRRWTAALQGAGFGALSGAVSVFCLASVYGLRAGVGFLLFATMFYCALWVGGYAFLRARGPALYR